MRVFSNTSFVLTELEQNNSSHIYLLNQTLKHCFEDFVEGYNVWEKSKAEIINKMAETLEKLHFLGEYSDPLNTISSYIKNELAVRGVSKGQLNYVSEVLPSKYKDQSYNNNPEGINNNNNNNNNNINNNTRSTGNHVDSDSTINQVPLVNSNDLLRKLEKMALTSPTEFQSYGMDLEQQQKHIRNNMKTHKETFEYVAMKHQIPVQKYKKVSAQVPPEHLQGPSLMQHKLKEMSRTVYDIAKYLDDIAKSVYEFPPEKAMAEKCAKQIDIFNRGVLQTIKMLLVPYSDKKYSGDWSTWFDINITKLEQSKNYAGSKHGLETGEFAVKLDKEGNEIILNLDRGITREQVGDREPDIYRMARQTLLGVPMFEALHKWSYETFIMEEYDENGNPIIKSPQLQQQQEQEEEALTAIAGDSCQ